MQVVFMNQIEIRKVDGRRDLNLFIDFPEKLYKGNQCWVPPIRRDEKKNLNPNKKQAIPFCKLCMWLAYKDGEVVGRIAGIINENANRDWKTKRVRFGWFDFIDDIQVAKALLEKVEQWGKLYGMNEICGPLGFTDMDREGMLIEGFENPASLTTIYNYPYYPKTMQCLGYEKDADWLQRELVVPEKMPDKIEYFKPLVEQHSGAHIKFITSKKEMKKYGEGMFYVVNNTFNKLYEFTPLTKEQIDKYVKSYSPFINKKYFATVVDNNDNLVGFALCFPSINNGLIKSRGRFTPSGICHLISSFFKTKTLELWLIGVLPEYQSTGVSALIFHRIIQQCIENNITRAITNPQLEDNLSALQLFDDFSIKQYQRRRCYKKMIN